jgi:NAD(P)H-nitrite reductase large subunit
MIKFYSTYCPRCRVLKEKLDSKNIKYELHTDTQEMVRLGLVNAPALQLEDGRLLDFGQAVKWVGGYNAD